MRFQKAIQMTSDIIEKLEDGEIALQSGQWVVFGSKKSRYVGRTNSGCLWIVHSQSDTAKYYALNDRYQERFADKGAAQ